MINHINSSIRFVFLLCLVAIFIIVPLVNIQELQDSAHSGKFMVFTAILAVASIFYSLKLFQIGRLEVNSFDLLFFIMVGVITLSRYVLFSYANFSIRYYELVGIFALYLMIRSLPMNTYRYLFSALILGGAIQAIYGNLQLYGVMESNHRLFKITGSFLNPGPYAGYLVSIWPLAFGLLLFGDNCLFEEPDCKEGRKNKLNMLLSTINKYTGIIALLSTLLILPLAQSRASWVAVFLVTTYFLSGKYNLKFYLKNIFDTTLKKLCLTLLVLVMAIAGLFKIYSLKQASSEGRLFIWKITTDMILNKPFTGHGFDRFRDRYMGFQADHFRSHINGKEIVNAGDTEYAFNDFLQFIAENGVVMLVIFTAMFVLLFRHKRLINENIVYLSRGGIISCMIFAMFSYPSSILPIMLTCTLYSAVIVTNLDLKCLISINLNSRYSKKMLYVVLILVVSFSIRLQLHLKDLYIAFDQWYLANKIYRAGHYDASLKYFKDAYSTFDSDGQFLTQYGKALLLSGRRGDALSALKRAQLFHNSVVLQVARGDAFKLSGEYWLAEQAYLDAWYMVPNRFYAKYLLAKLYLETDQNEKAIEVANELVIKTAKVSSPAVQQIVSEMKQLLKRK